MMPGDYRGAPKAGPTPEHQSVVPPGAGSPPYCTCGFVGGRGVEIDGVPLLADHMREIDPTW